MCFKTRNLACFSTIVFFVCLFFIIYLPPPPSRSATDWTTIEQADKDQPLFSHKADGVSKAPMS